MRKIVLGAAAVLTLGLAGCNESGPLARSGARVSAPGASVALISLEGAPNAVSVQLASALSTEAQSRQIAVVPDAANARYKLRGYVSAYTSEGSTAVNWVWDVFDSTQKRAQRLSGSQTVRATAQDPWAAVDEAALSALASRSMDGVAVFLSGGQPATTPAPAADPVAQPE
jgi:hypothetical protein